MPTDTPEPLSDAVPKYSAREIADWRKKHVPVILRGPEPQKHCGFDDAPWPCFTIAALNGWDALLAAREELEQAKADIMELMAEKLPDGTTLHRMVTTYPKMHQRMLGDADNEIAKLRQRAETAEANCAALMEAVRQWYGCPVMNSEADCGCNDCLWYRSILARPNPGAGLLERLRLLEALAVAARDMGGIDMGSYEDVPITDFDAVKHAVEAYDMALAQAGEEHH